MHFPTLAALVLICWAADAAALRLVSDLGDLDWSALLTASL